jgi:hypothetical protein
VARRRTILAGAVSRASRAEMFRLRHPAGSARLDQGSNQRAMLDEAGRDVYTMGL